MASSVLIVKLSSMGDVLHTLPAGLALRRALPEARIGWAVERAHAGLLAGQDWLDELIVWDRRNLRTFADFVRRIRAGRWEVAIDFQGLLRSGLVARLSGARQRVGYAPTRERAHWFYNRQVPLPTLDRHAVDRSLDLVRAAFPNAAHDAMQPRFPLHPTPADMAAVERWLCEQRFDPARERLVVLNPHCRKDANRWPAERFRELVGRLLERPQTRVALVGGPIARELCDDIAGPYAGRVLRADGCLSLLGTAELFRRAQVVVTGDTGPMHIAAAVETPIVALFGPANPTRTGPYADNAIVLNRHLECSPCYARSACPLGHAVPRCMDEIAVADVLVAIDRQLARPPLTLDARRSA